MATAGTPPSVRPAKARIRSSAGQLGSTEATRVRRADANSEPTMTGLRPHTSESGPAMSRPMPSRPVDSDSARLLSAGLTWNLAVKTGRRGCTQ